MASRDTLEALLAQCGSHRTRHSGRSLYHHLRGTELLLQCWQCAEEVCLAGLFHSVYGTNAFRHASLQIDERAAVADAIGVAAERLVYLFHLCERPGGFLTALRGERVGSRFDDTELAITRTELAGLIEIECANLLEQGSGARFLAALSIELPAHPLALSPRLMAEHLVPLS